MDILCHLVQVQVHITQHKSLCDRDKKRGAGGEKLAEFSSPLGGKIQLQYYLNVRALVIFILIPLIIGPVKKTKIK